MGNCFSEEHKQQYIPQGIPIATPQYLSDVSLCKQELPVSNNMPNIIVLNNGYHHYDPGFGLAATNGFLTGMLVGELLDDF